MANVAFVTGGTGFLGLHVIDALLEARWEVVALHRPSSRLDGLHERSVTLVPGDITDADSLHSAAPQHIDAIYHLAGDTNMWRANNARQTRVNVHGTRNVVELGLRRSVRRMVHTSSIAAFGLSETTVTEATPQRGHASWINYFRTKALAEDEVRAGVERGLDAVILNPANVIGPYDRHNWSQLIAMVHAGRLPGAPPGSGSFCAAQAVAQAHVVAFEKAQRGANYLLGGSDASYLELIRLIGRALARPVPRRPTPAFALRSLARLSDWFSRVTGSEPQLTPEKVALVTARWQCASTRAVRDIEYSPVALIDMVADCVEWMRTAELIR